MDRGVAVDGNLIEQYRVGHGGTGNDASVADDGVDGLSDPRQTVAVHLLIVDEFRRRLTEVVVVDGPFFVVEVQLRPGGAQIHVRLEVGLEGPDVAPVRLFGGRLPGDPVGVEVVGEKTARGHQGGNDVLPEVVAAGLVRVVILQKSLDVVGVENVIAHGRQAHIRIVGKRRGILRLFLESHDAPVLVHFDDPELMSFGNGDRDRRHRGDGSVFHVEIHHLTHVHPVDVISAEHGQQIRLEVFDQMRVLVDRIRRSAVPCAVFRLHLGGHGNDEASAHLGAGDVPAVDDVFHQTLRFELGQNKDAVDPAVHEITQHKVDDPVFSPERDCGFRALVGQRRKTRSLAAGEDHGKHRRSHVCKSPFLNHCMK